MNRNVFLLLFFSFSFSLLEDELLDEIVLAGLRVDERGQLHRQPVQLVLLLHDEGRQLLQLHLPGLGRRLEQVSGSYGRNFFAFDLFGDGVEDVGQRV